MAYLCCFYKSNHGRPGITKCTTQDFCPTQDDYTLTHHHETDRCEECPPGGGVMKASGCDECYQGVMYDTDPTLYDDDLNNNP
ncbi:hypothetical protein [Neobacillus sp. DY30]|uniref:hypothetical protein n=1 Tax=Neobacillus sp. DY30 TaxID=3047871 RepID=UPI0024C072D1|nr:hypothetical protein [Neobacillus sp. DY30]WHX97964.1 hypothetical protein QNH29_14865 [Neobacillus sp. DY30]